MNKPIPGSLADLLRQMRELHELKKMPQELRQAEENGFWWFMCLATPEIEVCLNDPERWAKVWRAWQAEAQKNFEQTAHRFKLPWLDGAAQRKN